jgi:hypothetical protein
VATRTPPPAEFRGRARLLRQRVFANDAVLNRVLRELTQLFAPDLRQNGTISPTTITRARIIWRGVPDSFGKSKVRTTRHSFAIDGAWLVGARFHHADWDANTDEPGVLLTTVRYSASRHGLKMQVDPLLNVSLHALSRWFERAPSTTDAALHAELVALLTAAGGGPWQGTEGIWLGSEEEVRSGKSTAKIRLVRTYLPSSAAYRDKAAA